MSGYKHIDLAYLNDISDGDAETKIQLTQLFFDQVDEIKERFSKAMGSNDLEEIQKTAHLAKSSTRVMGANDIANKMVELEQIIKQKTENFDYQPFINYFNDNIPFVIAELKAELSTL